MPNPKYRPNKKNGYQPPHMEDIRVGLVPIGCGLCMECMKKRANEWRVRLNEEIKNSKNGLFVTLTLSNESYASLAKECKGDAYVLENEIATLAVRRFLERWRKKYKKYPQKHWLITELGGKGTENIHLHGIIWDEKEKLKNINEIWKYGFTWEGYKKNGTTINYLSEATSAYITKYMTKTDPKHKYFKPKVLASKGVGRPSEKSEIYERNKYNGEKTRTTIISKTGHKMAMPIYWRNKVYTEEEREKLWIKKIEENTRYVGGEKIRADKEKNYNELVRYYRKLNNEMGYGAPDNYDAMEYEKQRKRINAEKRIEKARNETGQDGYI